MIEPCAGEAGEGVDDTTNVRSIVKDDEGVNGVMVHFLAGIDDLGIAADGLGVACHDLRNGCGKERLTKALHGATDIAVGDDADKFIILDNNAYTELTVRHDLQRLTHRCVRRHQRQVLRARRHDQALRAAGSP